MKLSWQVSWSVGSCPVFGVTFYWSCTDNRTFLFTSGCIFLRAFFLCSRICKTWMKYFAICLHWRSIWSVWRSIYHSSINEHQHSPHMMYICSRSQVHVDGKWVRTMFVCVLLHSEHSSYCHRLRQDEKYQWPCTWRIIFFDFFFYMNKQLKRAARPFLLSHCPSCNKIGFWP